MGITVRRLAVATLVALANAGPATACFETDTTLRPWVWFTSATTAEVAIEGMIVDPLGVGAGNYCAVGLGHSGTTISGVTALTVMDDPDPTAGPIPIAGLSFSANAATNADLLAGSPGSTWHGFHSTTGVPLVASTPVALVFSVTVPALTTYQDILEELQDFGLGGLSYALVTGSLTGPLEVEPIVGASDLPYCYDDTIQAGEVCDGLSDMGCTPGDSCVDCSVCTPANQSNECKADILRSLAYSERSQLKCYAREAKQGQPVDPLCLSVVNDVNLLWTKYVPSCPQTLPPAATVQPYIDSLGSDLVPLLPLGMVAGSFKCSAQKFKAASFRAVGATKCHSKAWNLNVAVDPVCLSRVDTKYQSKMARAELPGLCAPGNIGNAATVAARVDLFVNDIVTNIPPP